MWTFLNFTSDTPPGPSAVLALAAAGAGLILSALTIFIMPEIVAYLVAMFMLWGGATLVALAFRARKLNKQNWRGGAVWEIW